MGTICPEGPNFLGPFVHGTEFVGDHLSRGINFMGIVCPGGQEVGDQKSGDQIGLGTNVLQPKSYLGQCMALLRLLLD